MAEHPNARLVRSGYAAFARRDMATIMDLFAANIVWYQPGDNPLSGQHIGKDAVAEFLGKLTGLSGDTYKVELHDVLASDEHVVVLARETASRQGKQLDSLSVQVYHVREDKIIEAWSFIRDDRAYDEFWS